MSELLVGIDLGGTKVAISVGQSDGSVISRTRRPTEPTGDPERDVARLALDVRTILSAAGGSPGDVAVVGVSAPGPLDKTRRRLLSPPNLPGWSDVPLVEALEASLGRPVHLENDANAAAVAEWRFGAGRGYTSAVYLTMSTGVGAGLILDGRLFRGSHGAAGEVGHARIDWTADAALCSCGARGCLEAYVGGAAWTRSLRERTPPDSAAAREAGGVSGVTPVHLVEAARAGDAFALGEMARWNEYLARGIVNLAFTLAPEVVILGTIATAAGEELCLAPVRALVSRDLWDVIAEGLVILPGELGEELPYLAGLAAATEAER